MTLTYIDEKTPTLLRNVPGTALYFSTLQMIKTELMISMNKTNSDKLVQINMIAGSVSRVIAGSILMPFTVMKSQYESSLYNYANISDAIRSIYQRHGVKGFFHGIGSTALRDAPYAGIYYGAYEQCKAIGNQSTFGDQWGKTVVNLGASSTAGFAACLVTHPFDVVRTRIQLEPGVYHNMVKATVLIGNREGVRGFLAGIVPRLARKTLSAAITWTVYEELVAILSRPSPLE
eukprot:Partr_v1_DN28988_c0_g1_i5_m24846 putative solute carrier family 25, member 38